LSGLQADSGNGPASASLTVAARVRQSLKLSSKIMTPKSRGRFAGWLFGRSRREEIDAAPPTICSS